MFNLFLIWFKTCLNSKKKTFENLKKPYTIFGFVFVFNRITSNEIKCLRELTPGADCLRRS